MIQDSRADPLYPEKIKSFTDLKVWQESHALSISIYRTTRNFPKEELYSLTDQVKRASSSVGANIAEGFGRQTYKKKTQYYHQALGSLDELKNFLLLAKDIGYIANDDSVELIQSIDTTRRLLKGLISKTKSFIT